MAAQAPSRADQSWQTYKNERYAFRLSYPAQSRVETHRERGHQHITISRHANGEDSGAGADSEQLDLDIYIYDHRLGHRMRATCKDVLSEARAVKVGKVRGWRGVYQDSDNAEAPAQAVCVESTKLEILVKAVGNEPVSPLVDRVLDTVRFGN